MSHNTRTTVRRKYDVLSSTNVIFRLIIYPFVSSLGVRLFRALLKSGTYPSEN